MIQEKQSVSTCIQANECDGGEANRLKNWSFQAIEKNKPSNLQNENTNQVNPNLKQQNDHNFGITRI